MSNSGYPSESEPRKVSQLSRALSIASGEAKITFRNKTVLSGALIWWISSLIRKGTAPKGVLVGLTLITAGAVGNIIDSLFYGLIWDYAPFMFGQVVDMFFFPIIREGES